MKRFLLIFTAASLALSAGAQETYENANIATEDLNGTARYVGMGGAMDALGADLSTIGTNPAGIGLFRHSTANVSFGFVSQQGGKSFADGNKTNMSFDQAGFVYSTKTGPSSFLNVAFNYHKSRNFNYILSASDAFGYDANTGRGASQNKLTVMKEYEGVFRTYKDGNTYLADDYGFNQVDYLYYNALSTDENGDVYYNDASGYVFNRANTGYIGEYDINVSGNINDRVYLGFTVGISDVNYKGYSEYTEGLLNASGASVGDVTLVDERSITGTGFNFKFGAIVRPIEDNPFRVGLSIATPTYYDLTTSNSTALFNNSSVGLYDSYGVGESYDFALFTPWKFGLSLGTTVGNYLAVGAVYEYSDYGALDSRYNNGGYSDNVWGNSSSDNAMNRHTERTLKGVSTLKLGLEYKPEKNLALRLGYNYVSPMYNKDGFKDGTISSLGSYYSSATDYTNWGATNRFTCGLGYNTKNFSVDLAYQYSAQSGDFSPFMSYEAAPNDPQEYSNFCNAVKVDNKRHQLLLTLGYHF